MHAITTAGSHMQVKRPSRRGHRTVCTYESMLADPGQTADVDCELKYHEILGNFPEVPLLK